MAAVEVVVRMASLILLLAVAKQLVIARALMQQAKMEVGPVLQGAMEGPAVLVTPASSPGAGDGGAELLEVYLLGKGLGSLRGETGSRNSIAVRNVQEALRCGASETKAIAIRAPPQHFLEILASRKILRINAIGVDTIGSFLEIVGPRVTWVIVLEEKDAEELLLECKNKGMSGEVYHNVSDIVALVETNRIR